MSRLFFDITDLLEYARKNTTLSGIQRVYVELISNLLQEHGPEKLRLIAFHPILKRPVSYDPEYFGPGFEYQQSDFCEYFGLHSSLHNPNLDNYLAKKYQNSWKTSFHRTRLLALNTLTRGETLRKRKIQTSPAFSSTPHNPKTVDFKSGDHVFIPGATWNFEPYLNFLAFQRKARGIRITHFIHDLIPIHTPEHVVDDVPQQFLRWLEHLAGNSDFFITNSHATKRDLDAWLAARGISIGSEVVPLAHQFANYPRGGHQVNFAGRGNEKIHARIINAARIPYALCVGTLESRKNIWALANVWKSLLDKLGYDTPRLLFAGKHGWLKEDFDDFIVGTGALGGHIRIIDRPNDAELAYLYSNCLFSIFVSFKEGWGLPIGESLWFGRPVICSNVSSMPEVGGNLAEYVNPYSLASIEEAVIKLTLDNEYREQKCRQIAQAHLRSWSDVALDLSQLLTQSINYKGRRHAHAG